jgi:hypothetical protein
MQVDKESGELKLNNKEGSAGNYDLEIVQVGSSGVYTFTTNAISLAAGDTHWIDYGSWSNTGHGITMTLHIDEGSDGTRDKTIILGQQPVASIELVVEKDSIPADGQSTTNITAIVKDANDNPVTNTQVTFATNLGTIAPETDSTDDQGIATTVLTAAGTPGTATVSATVGDIQKDYSVSFSEQEDEPVYLPLVQR